MKALWIRVQARKVSSLEINQLADALGISCVHALGHYTALGGEIAEALPDGIIADVADTTIERWAQWTGKRGAFAAAIRDVMQNEAGEFDEWSETMGQLVERRAKDRARKTGGNSVETPRKPRGNSVESRRDSAATERNGTERNGTVGSEGSNWRSGEAAAPASETATAPPADAATTTANRTDTITFGPAASEFVARFYGAATSKRRSDVTWQLVRTLGIGASHPRAPKTFVFARSAERLERKAREVLEEGVKDPDKAIVVLLLKLADTTDVSEQHAAATKREEREADEEQRHNLGHALAWLAEHPDVAASIETVEEIADSSDVGAIALRFARNARILAAWRAAGAPRTAGVGS